MDNYDSILKEAYEYGERRHPGAPSAHHAAFANSVAYALTGASGGYGGPSMREHLAIRLITDGFGSGAGCRTFEQVAELIDECCYGPLTRQHAMMLRCCHCFGDPPGEVETAHGLLATA